MVPPPDDVRASTLGAWLGRMNHTNPLAITRTQRRIAAVVRMALHQPPRRAEHSRTRPITTSYAARPVFHAVLVPPNWLHPSYGGNSLRRRSSRRSGDRAGYAPGDVHYQDMADDQPSTSGAQPTAVRAPTRRQFTN